MVGPLCQLSLSWSLYYGLHYPSVSNPVAFWIVQDFSSGLWNNIHLQNTVLEMQCSQVGINSCILKMKTGFSKTLVNLYCMALYHTPEGRDIVFVTMITFNLIGSSHWYKFGSWSYCDVKVVSFMRHWDLSTRILGFHMIMVKYVILFT